MRVHFDRFYPYVFGVMGIAALLRWGTLVQNQAATASVNLKEIFSSIFDVATLFTGLLFSVYVLAIAPGGGFIERIFSTKTFSLFKRYTIEAMVLGSLSSLISIPLRSLEKLPPSNNENWMIVFAIWGGLAVAATFAFYRVVYAFYVFAQQDRRLRKSK